MPLVNADKLVEEGMSPSLVQRYVAAVNAAWDEVAPTPGLRTRPSMFLHLQDPDRDRQTVTVTVGLGARYGSAQGTTPDELGKSLLQHLKTLG
jgi:hypothetical protein